LNQRQFIQSLTAEQRRQLTQKSNHAGLYALAFHVGALLFTSAMILSKVPGWPLWLVPHGILLVFLFTAMHECVHRTAFASEALNRLVAASCGFILLIPRRWFTHFHFAHHRHTQDPDKDPELTSAKPTTYAQYVWHVSGLPLWRSAIVTLIRNASGHCNDRFIPQPERRTIQLEAMTMGALYGLIITLSIGLASTALIWIWLVPALLGQPFLRLYLLAEHSRCAYVENMFINTRTTFTRRWVRHRARLHPI